MVTEGLFDTPGVIDCAVHGNQYRYIQYHAGGRELYLEGGGPNEFTNVASDPQFAALIASRSACVPG
jgi:hypothetical protein